MRVEIAAASFDPHKALAAFSAPHAEAGALASFVGYCRAHSNGKAVERLELEHYPGLTESEIARIAAAIAAKHGLLDLLVIHRVGAIAAGEAIVLAAAVSAQRAAAFAAVEELMDALKTDAPIWKREIGPDGARWIEPTPQDHARRAAHEEKSR